MGRCEAVKSGGGRRGKAEVGAGKGEQVENGTLLARAGQYGRPVEPSPELEKRVLFLLGAWAKHLEHRFIGEIHRIVRELPDVNAPEWADFVFAEAAMQLLMGTDGNEVERIESLCSWESTKIDRLPQEKRPRIYRRLEDRTPCHVEEWDSAPGGDGKG